VVEIVRRLNARPGVAVPRIPYLDDALVGGEDLRLGCLGPGGGSRVEIDEIFD
jgi:hypothetical protein